MLISREGGGKAALNMEGCRWKANFDSIAADSPSFDAISTIVSTFVKDNDL